MPKDKTPSGGSEGVGLDFTREEASLILAIVQQTWKTPLGTREAALLLSVIQAKLEEHVGTQNRGPTPFS